MALTKVYLPISVLRESVGDDDPTSLDNGQYEQAIEAASRQIDLWCDPDGTRHFWATDIVEARTFSPKNRWLVMPGFFRSTDGLVLKTDDNGDGTFETTWTLGTDYQAQPGARPNGEPYTKLVATGTKTFPVSGRRQCVQIATDKWGCDAFPALVVRSCRILSTALYKSKDFSGGDMGFKNLGGDQGGWTVYDLARSLIEDYQLDPTPKRAA
jgi:hypothetical protein